MRLDRPGEGKLIYGIARPEQADSIRCVPSAREFPDQRRATGPCHQLKQPRRSGAEFSQLYLAEATSLIPVSLGAVFSACFLASVRRSLILSPRSA